MIRFLKRSHKGFTLTEILLTVVILAILAVLIVPRIIGWVHKASRAEGIVNLGAIRNAELLIHQLAGRFKLAEDRPAIQSVLDLTVGSKFYTYKVIEASEEDFLALATPVWPYSQWLEEIAINKDGFLTPIGFDVSGRTGSGGSAGGTGGGSGAGGGGIGGGGGSIGTIGAPGSGSGGNPTYTYITETIVSYYVNAPVNLKLTANNGWLVLGFTPYIDVNGYKIQVAEKIDGVIQGWNYVDPFFELGGVFGSGGWEDKVDNGKEYCYRATAVATVPDGQTLESPPSEVVCGKADANSGAAVKMEAGRTKLSSVPDYVNADNPITGYQVGVPSGAYEAQFLEDNDIPILIGTSPGQNGALAYQNPITKVLVLDTAYMNAPDQVIATLLAHETLHAIWDKDYERLDQVPPLVPEFGVPNPSYANSRNPNSIDQEYRAFTMNAQAWRQLKSELTPDEIVQWGEDFNAWEALVLNADGSLKPEDEAKEVVRNVYAYLVANGWEY